MPDIALRPRSATEIVDAAFQLYRRDPIPFITALALIYVPWLVLSAATGLTMDVAEMSAGNTRSVTLFLLGSAVAYLLATSITTVLANEAYFGREADVAKGFRVLVRRLGAIALAAFVISAILTIGFVVVSVVLAVIGVATVGSAAFAVVFLMLIPLAGYMYCRLFATKQIILFEERGGVASIGRSWTLTTRNVGHIFRTLGLALLLNLAIGVGATMFARLVPSQIVQQVIGTLVGCLVYPLVGIIQTMLYYDIRIRREGFDIQYLASTSDASPLEPTATT
jgi:hypothetical protein